MSNHEQAIVPIGAGPYHSPDLLDKGRIVDIGLLAESLLYYDRVVVDVTEAKQLEALITWFDEQAKVPDLIALIRDGTLSFLAYTFFPILPSSRHAGIGNKFLSYGLSADKNNKPVCWPYEYVLGGALNNIIENHLYVKQLQSAISDHFLIRNDTEYRPGLQKVKADLGRLERFSLVVQSFIDELHEIRGLRLPPMAKISLQPIGIGTTEIGQYGPVSQVRLDLGIAPELWASRLGPRIPFSLDTAVLAQCDCDRITRTSQSLNTDLYLPSPMSTLVGDTLYETARVVKLESIIEELKSKVEFPDIRRLSTRGV